MNKKLKLSWRNRAMLGVIKYFAKSLKVTKGQITPLSRACVRPYCIVTMTVSRTVSEIFSVK